MRLFFLLFVLVCALDIVRVGKIGQGNYGVVSLARLNSTLVAVKTPLEYEYMDEMTQSIQDLSFENEYKLLSILRGQRNVIQMLAESTPKQLILEYYPYRDLKVLAASFPSLAERMQDAIVGDMTRALLQIHSSGVCNRDITLTSFLLTQNTSGQVDYDLPLVKIIDFGFGTLREQGGERACRFDLLSLASCVAALYTGLPEGLEMETYTGLSAKQLEIVKRISNGDLNKAMAQ